MGARTEGPTQPTQEDQPGAAAAPPSDKRGAAPVIVLLEDDEERALRMMASLRTAVPAVEIHRFDEAPSLIAWLGQHLARVTVLSLDHDLGPSRAAADGARREPGTGRDVVDNLVGLAPRRPVVIHSANVPAALGMHFALDATGWSSVRVPPFREFAWIDLTWVPTLVRLLEAT